jgi:hypothetical protein
VEHADGTLEVVRWDGEKIIGDVCERPKLLEMDYVVSPDTNNCPEKRVPLAV